MFCMFLYSVFTWFDSGYMFGVTIHLALCSLFVFAPKMLGILVGMDQKDIYGDVGKDCALALLGLVLVFTAENGFMVQTVQTVWMFRSCSSSTRPFGRISHVLCVKVARSLRGDVVDTPVVAQMQIPMVRFT